jgi:TPR repeat protein
MMASTTSDAARRLPTPYSEGGGSITAVGEWQPPPSGYAIDVEFALRWDGLNHAAVAKWAANHKATPNGQFLHSALLLSRDGSDVTAAIKGLLYAEEQGIVAASYQLGLAYERMGNIGMAAAAYTRAAASGFVGGLLGLRSLDSTSPQATVELLRRFVSATSAPDALDCALRVGAVSSLVDAAWLAAEFLRFGDRTPEDIWDHRKTGGRPRSSDTTSIAASATIESLLSLGARLGDDFCAFARIEERAGLHRHTLQGLGLPSHCELDDSRSTEAIALCDALHRSSKESHWRAKAAAYAAELITYDMDESDTLRSYEAMEWNRKAADEEEPEAMSVMTMFVALDSGDGVLPRDQVAARK